jgi:hypothetical protein
MSQVHERESPSVRLVLSHQEAALLRKAAQRYRATLPSYLQSSREELALLEELLQKLGTP